MRITIKYFGLLTEITGCSNETLEFKGKTVGEFLSHLYKKYPSLENKDFQTAQNQELASPEELIDGTEIALLPPFSGG